MIPRLIVVMFIEKNSWYITMRNPKRTDILTRVEKLPSPISPLTAVKIWNRKSPFPKEKTSTTLSL
jgi:hypothetical protein